MDQHSSIGILERDTHGGGTKEVIRVTIILSVLTIIELVFGFVMMKMDDGFTKHAIKGIIIILMLAKAFYIVGYFMHLKHEVKNMIMTIVVPLLLFVWFIIAFLMDGHSFNQLKNNYNRYYESRKTEKAVIKEEKTEEPKKETEQ